MSFSRRDFLRKSGGALGASALVSRFSLMSALAGGKTSDFKALVCIYMHGGNDGFNTVVPYEQNEYNYYASVRPTIALPRANLLPITPQTPLPNGRAFGLHPSLTELQALWNSQKLATICNLGTLLQPMTPAEYRSKAKAAPISLFDHNVQSNSWSDLGAGGWGQTIGLALQNLNTAPRLPMLLNVSYGSTVYLAGTQPYITLSPGSTLGLNGFTSSSASTARYNSLRETLKLPTDSALVNVLGNTVSNSIDNAQIASQALGAANIQTKFPTSGLGQQLLQIAKILSVRNTLGLNARQVFYADIGGFDTHSGQLVQQVTNMSAVSQAMMAFYNATVELGISANVATFTLSEFGRTMQNSGDGTDHAWGSQAFVMGDSVNGGDFYGQYPTITLGGASDADTGSGARGRFVPTTAVDQYAATLGTWFGLNSTALQMAIPNINRFAPTNLGFMKP